MADSTTFQTAQGLKGESISLLAGEAAIIIFDRAIPWDRGGVSVTLTPGDTGEVVYEHSLEAEGDDWTPDLGSPFSEPVSHKETGRISRLRIRAVDGPAKASVLAPQGFKLELV